MNTLDDWPRVKRVLENALEREGAERQAYLDQVCGTDAELRSRVERMLAADDRLGNFLETPAVVLLDPQDRNNLSGRIVDSYQLVSLLGTGGMSEVYLAHDTRLDRPVAVKFLSSDLAVDRHRLRRFHQEARAASSLNHPNIVVVHDFGELEGRPYIVTEFIEGETLRHRLREGPLAMSDVVDIGVQVAGALAAAHVRGLVHRDIKPENVMLRADGYVKVLDFGLAKLAASTPSADQAGEGSHTQTGVVFGTPRYMSPEQARGLDLDARSDVWSFGVVLYEMATGRLPFADSGAGMAVDRDLPPALLAIVSKALQTVRDLRHASGAELCADLKEVQRETIPRRSRKRSRTLMAGTTIVAMALGVLLSVVLMRSSRVTVRSGVQKTVAVLPFDNISGGRDIDYLRLALADEVTTALSWAPSLAVRPMSASRKLAGEASVQEAGLRLRVGEVVTGHFSRRESALDVTVEAVEVDGNRLLWRDTIEVPTNDPIALRDQLTSRIRNGLLPALGTPTPATARPRPQNADAYATYLRSLAISTDPSPNREAIAMLERTSLMEPDYPDTWVALADRYYYDGHYGGGGGAALRRSEAAARQALALAPDHMAAAVRLYGLQVEAGRLQDGYDSALQLVTRHPESGDARFALSYVFRYGGLLEESARACEQAVSRDPTNPTFRSCATQFMLLGRYDRALDFVRLDSGSEWAKLVSRFIYERMGRRDEARQQHDGLPPQYISGMAPAMFHGLLSRCLAGAPPDQQGNITDDDVRIFLTVRDDPEPLYYWASDLAYCGHTTAAIQLLRESIRRNFCGVTAIEIDPAFAAFRASAEYGELLAAAQACRARFQDHVRATNPPHK
jgi:serine/threonine protein kinase